MYYRTEIQVYWRHFYNCNIDNPALKTGAENNRPHYGSGHKKHSQNLAKLTHKVTNDGHKAWCMLCALLQPWLVHTPLSHHIAFFFNGDDMEDKPSSCRAQQPATHDSCVNYLTSTCGFKSTVPMGTALWLRLSTTPFQCDSSTSAAETICTTGAGRWRATRQ